MNLIVVEKKNGKIHLDNGGIFDAECGADLMALELVAINPCDADEKEKQLLADRPLCKRCEKLMLKASTNLCLALFGA